MDDKELFGQLEGGPLARNGFDDKLRNKIHERIRDPRSRKKKPWTMPMFKLGAAAMTLVLAFGGIWAWENSKTGGKAANQSSLSTAGASNAASAEPAAPPKLRSALLVGLRKDPSEGDANVSYRTVLVAPQDEKSLEVAANGAGIWMPYKQQFWKVDGIPDSQGKGMYKLLASPSNKQLPERVESDSPYRGTEKLLYAGNKYVSVLRSTAVDELGAEASANEVWVKDVTQLASGSGQPAADSNVADAEPHYKLSEIVETDNALASADQWTIARVPGKWVAKMPASASNVLGAAANAVSIADWQEMGVPLTYDIVSHDALALKWDDIYSLEPSAKDAFTSPKEDMLAVVVDGAIDVYPYGLGDEGKSALKIALDPNESIVMVQWAVVDSYVESWKRILGQQIPPARANGL